MLTATIACQSVVFAPRVDFGMAQENAQQSVCDDFDHDGNLDIAATMEGYNQGKVEVLFGDGASDFGSSTEFPSYVAYGLCAGDVDGDGWSDLVATSYGWAQHGVRVYRNDHAGGFVNVANVSTLATSPAGVVAGDLDGDGVLDLAAVSETGGYAVDWFHGYGNGTFSTFHVVPNTYGLTGRRIYTGRFNSDAHLDLLAIHSTGAMVLLNDNQGTGSFNSSNGIVVTEAMSSAVVADVDGDGLDDVITSGTTLKVWHSNGDGTFSLLHSYAASGSLDTELGDLDHDGLLDLVLVGYGGVEIHFGLGAGAFGNPQVVASGVYPKSVVIGDWNGDGFRDLGVTCQNYAGMSAYLAIHEQIPPSIAATAGAYGSGCGTPALTFTPDPLARPRLGQAGRVLVSNAPTSFVGVALGFSDQTAAGLPLPASLAAIGMPGCDLLQSADWMGLGVSPVVGGGYRFQASIPNLLDLLGLHVYLQAYALAPGANAFEVVSSNGVDWLLGNA